MKVKDAVKLFEQSKKRCLLIGDEKAGVLVGLDLEGRLWAVKDGVILNRFNPDAVTGQPTRETYLNPGGDGLWPAPEGSRLGYEYATETWRVPPGLTGARYIVVESSANRAVIRAEVDLINATGLGIATAFERDIRIENADAGITVTVVESIEYIGSRELSSQECLLAAWSLCQFDSNDGCEVVFPSAGADCVWDLYEPSDSQRHNDGKFWHTKTQPTAGRYQIGMSREVEWIEFRNPRTGVVVRRSAEPIALEQDYIDITDRPPTESPASRGVRFSAYNDPSGFMEIEAAGGCAQVICPGAKSIVKTITEYSSMISI